MIVVNFSTNGYKAGQKRLSQSLGKWPQLMFTEYDQIGSPTHQESPYQFKIHAFEKAWEMDDVVLWLDSSVYRVGDMNKIENIILEKGYWLEEAGHYVGRWTNDFQKKYFNLSEQELFQGEGGLTLFSAGYMGLDKRSPVAMEFFKQWKQAGLDGAFRGSWENSRHEMLCGSVIAQRLGMTYEKGGSNASYIGHGYGPPAKGVTFHLQGMA